MCSNPSDPGTSAAPRQSVTRLGAPFLGEMSLPADLLAAYNLAAHAVSNARQVVMTCQMFAASDGGEEEVAGYARLIAESAKEIWAEYAYHTSLANVAAELAEASDPGSHFGGTSAHEAALSYGDRVLDAVWWVADPLQHSQFRRHRAVQIDVSKIPVRLWSIAKQLSKIEWPDGDALIAACQAEARRAAARRAPKSDLQRPLPAVGAPTVWFHANRCYSADGINMRTVTVEEDDVIQAFLWNKPELGLAELSRVCGAYDFARIIDGLRSKYGAVFAKAIQKPQPGAPGVYVVRVKRVPKAN